MMLTGRRMYTGETASETLAAVIMKEPDLGALPAGTPAGVRMVLRRCLDRDAKRRLRDIGEARIAIEDALSGTVGAEPAAPAPVRAGRPLAAWILAAAATVAALALGFIHFRETPPPVRAMRFSISPPQKALIHTFALSPDSRYLVIAAAAQGKSGLWVRPLDSLNYQLLASTEGATYPFWSPDSRSIAFFAGGKLKKVAVTGGPVQTVCEATGGRGGTWYPDGTIVFAPAAAGGIYRVPATGGAATPAVAYEDNRGLGFQRFPTSLGGGRYFLFTISSALGERNGIYLGQLGSKETRRLMTETSSIAYAAPAAGERIGHLLFLRQSTLMAQPFDAARLELKDEALPVAEQVGIAANVFFGAFSASQNGALAYRAGGGDRRLAVWFDRDGKRLDTVGEPASYGWLAISPDQQRVVRSIASLNQTQDLWMHDLARGAISRFTFGPGTNTNPVWSPDGSRIAFASNRRGPIDIYQKTASGGGKDELLLKADAPSRPTDWSSDGRFLAFMSYKKSSWDLWLLPLEGDRKPVPFLETEFDEEDGHFSPDGRWMAYASNENGSYQVYVQPLPPTGAKYQISTAGGRRPRWRRDGKELYYIAADEKLVAVAMRATAAGFEAGIPQPLFDTRIAGAPLQFGSAYEASRDGRRFLINVPAEESTEVPITVVLNWQKTIGGKQ